MLVQLTTCEYGQTIINTKCVKLVTCDHVSDVTTIYLLDGTVLYSEDGCDRVCGKILGLTGRDQ